MDEILLLLLRSGAHQKPARFTTAELGAEIGISQQTASRRLTELGKEGYVERSAAGIRLTKKAYDEMAKTYAVMKSIFEAKLEIAGTIVTGLGEGAYYTSLEGYRKQMKDKLGFEPHLGTLNIRLRDEESWKKEQLLSSEPIIISGFKDKERSYGDLYAFPCRIEGLDCAVIMPLRTSHGPQILEIICGSDIRKRLRKKDGDKLTVVL